MDSKTLKDLDIVLASIHSNKSDINTDSIIKVLENDDVDVLAHPTGRKLNQRKPYELDLDLIFETSHETGTILEIDSQPKRLDLKDEHVRRAIEHDCKLIVDTDAHGRAQMSFMQLGVATARRGWATKKDVVNTLPFKKFMKCLK